MGVEYKHYLIPTDNTVRPGPEALARLVDALIRDGFVADPNSERFAGMTFTVFRFYKAAATTGVFAHRPNGDRSPFPCPCSAADIEALGDGDFQLVWPVESINGSRLSYPLVPFPEWGDADHTLEIHLADDFVYHISELIDPFDDPAEIVKCSCGHSLESTDAMWDGRGSPTPHGFDGRIARICPACGTPFRPQDHHATIRDGHTNRPSTRAGGVTYRFAIVVDCGKGFAREGWPIRASPAFLDTVSNALGLEFYEVGDIY